jgi:hypothetical protein
MSLLLTRQPVYQESALLDPAGREQVRLSQSGVVSSAELRDRADDPAFQVPAQTHDVYYSPVYFGPSSDEPLMTMAVPVIDSRTGDIQHRAAGRRARAVTPECVQDGRPGYSMSRLPSALNFQSSQCMTSQK